VARDGAAARARQRGHGSQWSYELPARFGVATTPVIHVTTELQTTSLLNRDDWLSTPELPCHDGIFLNANRAITMKPES
jgi:hypothetical protein